VPGIEGRGAVRAGITSAEATADRGRDERWGLHGRVERQVFTEFSHTPPVTEPLVPLTEAVHDRAVIEVMRGCSAGCRFCQAGFWYRPVRERPVDLVVESALRALESTGCDEVSLISLSSCDYSGIEGVVKGIRERRPGVRVSLPSLRIDSAAVSLARLGSDQRGSVTLAPEAGTQALRNAINKRVDDGQFLEAVGAAYGSGFTRLKLYFMIGLPGESDDDVRAIAAMAGTALAEGRRRIGGRAQLSVSVSSFVPKPHTPLQWEPYSGTATILARQGQLRAAMPRGVRLSFHDVGSSQVEATLARGGSELARLVEGAWRQGARFDSWREHFDIGVWRRAAEPLGIDLDEPGVASPGDRLPWDVVDARLEPGFLREERESLAMERTRDDCRFGFCSDCGACVGDIEMDLAG
jgi:hypothetical protein